MLHWTSHGLNTRIFLPSLSIYFPALSKKLFQWLSSQRSSNIFSLLLFSFNYYLRENNSHKIGVEIEKWMHLLNFSLHSQLITVKLKKWKTWKKYFTMPRQYTDREKIAPQQSCNLYTISIFMFSPCFCFFLFLLWNFVVH